MLTLVKSKQSANDNLTIAFTTTYSQLWHIKNYQNKAWDVFVKIFLICLA